MGYGHRVSSLEAFLGSMGSVTSPETARHRLSGLRPTDLPIGPPTGLLRVQPSPGRPTLLRPPSAIRQPLGQIAPEGTAPTSPLLDLARTRWYWNIDQLCIDYAFRPRLSSRLTLGGLAFPRNPWAFGGGVSHPSLATHACILTRYRSTGPSRAGFTAASTLLYHSYIRTNP